MFSPTPKNEKEEELNRICTLSGMEWNRENSGAYYV